MDVNGLGAVDDVGVVNDVESGRGGRGGVVVAEALEGVVDTEAVLVRGGLAVDEVDVDEVEAVGADDDEASVTAPT